ncbi:MULTISPECIES: hypothetical protein [unclassified Streptomyces]|uniref:hypothetical protein n=1 Tax=unclassified Streptomyces TaxID=2593676 RepID=UPI003800531E
MPDREEAPGQWRTDAARARRELGGAVARFAARTEARVHPRERAAAARQRIGARTAQAKDTAARGLEHVHERTPAPVRQRARKAAVVAGRNRDQILAVVSGIVLIYLAVRRTRR